MSWEPAHQISKVTICLSSEFHGMIFKILLQNSMKKKAGTNTGFQLRRNGNMLRVQEQQRDIHLVMMNLSLAIMPGILEIQEAKLTMLVRKNPIHGVCTIC